LGLVLAATRYERKFLIRTSSAGLEPLLIAQTYPALPTVISVFSGVLLAFCELRGKTSVVYRRRL